MVSEAAVSCPICSSGVLERAWRYRRAPDGETRFAALEGAPYVRDVMRCASCEHFTSEPPLDPRVLYRDAYVDATYGDSGLRDAFERIMSLPAERSDNRQRVARVVAFVEGRRTRGRPRALDIGSGLAVFPAALAQHGWACTALDPDPRAAAHADGVEGVEGLCADLMDTELRPAFDLVTLNKVLEHVRDPAAMLRRAGGFLSEGGIVYAEVPDGPAAAVEGPEREEFFIEHLHVFSEASFRALAGAAGLVVMEVDRLHEPSGKYTLAGFFEAARHA